MDPVTGLSLGRIAIGAVALTSPPLAARLFQLDAAGNPQLPYMSRMFGSREIALGVTTLLARGPARTVLVRAGIAVDTADAVAAMLAARDGSVSKPVGGFLTAPAVGAAVAGIVTARR